MNDARVVFRFDSGMQPKWQFYGIDLPVFGGSDTLANAKHDAIEAFKELLDVEDVVLVAHEERQALAATSEHPAVYVRALQDNDPKRRNIRQELALRFIRMLELDPSLKKSFGKQTTGLGDVVAVVALPDDLLGAALGNISEYDTIHFGMPFQNRVYWQAISGHDAESIPTNAKSLEDVGAQSTMTIQDLMMRVGSFDPSGEKTLTLA